MKWRRISDSFVGSAGLPRRTYVLLALWALVVVISTLLCVRNSRLNPYISYYQSQVNLTLPPENQIDGFTFYHYDPVTNYLSFAAGAESLRSQNATLGIFKTAAAKEIQIRDLFLRFCRRPGDQTEKGSGVFFSADGDDDIFIQLANAKNYWNVDIDLGNATVLAIDNFECSFFDNDDLLLSVRSKRAIINSGWPQVTLRGHVIITCPDGSRLETNQARWDTKKHSFTADGQYFLRRGDNQIAGKGICVDNKLNILKSRNIRE